jgi:hypothetical protein
VAAENRHGVGPEIQAVTTRTLEEGKMEWRKQIINYRTIVSLLLGLFVSRRFTQERKTVL